VGVSGDTNYNAPATQIPIQWPGTSLTRGVLVGHCGMVLELPTVHAPMRIAVALHPSATVNAQAWAVS
jgi:hypothetical protein